MWATANRSSSISSRARRVTKRQMLPDREVCPSRDRRSLPTDASSEAAAEVFAEETVVFVEDRPVTDEKMVSNPSLLRASAASVAVVAKVAEAAVEEAVDLTDIEDFLDETSLDERAVSGPEMRTRRARMWTANRISGNRPTIARDAVEEEDQRDSIAAFSGAAHVGRVLTLRAVSPV